MIMENKLEKILKENNYSLDYLSSGSPIFQCKNLYTFTSDSITLAKSVKENEIETLVDMCSGSGVVGLEVMERANVNRLVMVEVQKELINMAKCSISVNPNKEKITVLNIDAKDTLMYIKEETVDVVIMNPPYFKKGSGKPAKNASRHTARTEESLTLEGFINIISKLLKPNGKLYMVHIKDREEEIIKLLNKYGLTIIELKTLEGKLKRIVIESIKTKN